MKDPMGRKKIIAILLFFAVLGLTAHMAYRINDGTPAYESGAVLDPGAYPDLMKVYGLESLGEGRLLLRLQSRGPIDSLALVFSNAAAIRIEQDGELIYASHLSDHYSRIQTVALRRFSGGSLISIAAVSDDSGKPLSKHILLGNYYYVLNKSLNSSICYTFFLGILTLMFVSCLILYLCKNNEKYLYHLMVAALLTLGSLAITFGLLDCSFATAPSLRSSMLALCLVECFLAVRESYPEEGRERSHRLKAFIVFAADAVALLICTGLFSSPANFIIRLLVLPPIILRLARSYAGGRRSALFLLLAYGVMEGLGQISFFGTKYFHYGELFCFWRVTELAHIVFLLAAVCVVNQRFADRFKQSEILQGQLAALNATLEEKVEGRTRELEDQQERRQATMQNIFHDLRSPIYLMEEQVEKLPDTADFSKVKADFLQRLHYLHRLAEDLFLLANLESDNVIFDEDEVDIRGICAQLCGDMQSAAGRKGISVCLTGSEAVMVWGDHFRLQQAMQNLLENAFNHTPPGGRVTVGMRLENGAVEISFHNTGSYIPPSEIPLVLQRYYRSKRAHNPHSSGLGLSISKEIIEAHGGRVSVESQREAGTAFTVELPTL